MKLSNTLRAWGLPMVLCCAVVSPSAWAGQPPSTSWTQESRIVSVNYQHNRIVPLVGTANITTQVEFAPDETIELVESGQSEAWSVDVQSHLRNRLFIKPLYDAPGTNLTVVTDKHTYYFALSAQAKGTPTYGLSFRYPQAEHAKQQARLAKAKNQQAATLNKAAPPGHYHWSYRFSGDRGLIPLHAYDDGVFTYFQLRPHQKVPAVFAIDNKKGEEQVVNVRQEGDVLVVQRVAPQFTLRDGRHHVASIFNNRLIRQQRRLSRGV